MRRRRRRCCCMVNTNGREEQGGGSIRARQKWYYCSPEILFSLPLSLLGHRNEMLLFDILPWLVCGQLAEWLGCKRRQLTDDNRIKGARLGGISLFSSALWSPHDFFLSFLCWSLGPTSQHKRSKIWWGNHVNLNLWREMRDRWWIALWYRRSGEEDDSSLLHFRVRR